MNGLVGASDSFDHDFRRYTNVYVGLCMYYMYVSSLLVGGMGPRLNSTRPDPTHGSTQPMDNSGVSPVGQCSSRRTVKVQVRAPQD